MFTFRFDTKAAVLTAALLAAAAPVAAQVAYQVGDGDGDTYLFLDEQGGGYLGVRLEEETELAEGGARVTHVVADSPAAEAGLGVGDLILSVGDVSATELDFPSLREQLGDGDAGPVVLEVEDRAGERRTVAVTPAQVLDPSVRRIRMIEHGDLDVGYLSIGSFTRRTAGEFDVVTRELRTRGADAFVIDLRGNLGGVLDSALAIADRFVPEGALLQTESRSGVEISWSTPSETTLRDVPVAVLIDRDSASASEVLAGALQDHRLGVLVGEPSYGKGTVQTLTRLPELEGVLATMAQIPERRVKGGDRERLQQLEGELKEVVFGQDAAIGRLVSAIKVARAGLRDPQKPMGCFLFTGPTGVGNSRNSSTVSEMADRLRNQSS